ncbi:OmpH family outer membrane protein [Bdellovibrio sp. HCB-162]|uniref:OmpH family outer membrane protein n=1 Tax=Bdellovibrio sp. HCB-162 TaxID=3394234 RepID=UPI0039BCA3F8
MLRMFFFMTAVLLAAAFANAESQVGFVDIPKAVQATSVGKKAKAELEVQFNKKKKELDQKEANLRKLRDDLDKKKSVLSAAALKEKQTELQNEMLKFREELGQSQADIQKKNDELTKPVMEKLQRVIAKVSKDKGFSIVFQGTPDILYANPAVDLTDDVVKEFEKEK